MRNLSELLLKLKNIAQSGPVESKIIADTAIGRTLERALGIKINSSKLPDYKGIELKSFRNTRSPVRKNLFAQVPNWKISKFKSSAKILDTFGYVSGSDFKLYCTVSAKKANSQGLMLKVKTDINHLIENSNKAQIGDFVIWELDKLHKRLSEKHKETFWVSADSIKNNNKEYFQYKEVLHTQKPISSQFDILLEQSLITVDHLIKRSNGKAAKEKGPLFKIDSKSLGLLFPPAKTYNLL